eukprot:298669-Prorocentrum_minimum.AAC.2
MANPQPELPVMAIQKAYNRMIDAPTVCADSNAATTTPPSTRTGIIIAKLRRLHTTTRRAARKTAPKGGEG